MMALGVGILLLIAMTAFVVIHTDDVTSQLLALSFYGLLFALMFFIFQAPDVALSQITVGAVALPLMIMLAITRMRNRDAARRREEKSHE
jgi:energy-converting hydrogenase B subunit D